MILVSGCDNYYGVHRTMNVDVPVLHTCVIQALKQTEGVTDIKYSLVANKDEYQRHFYDYKYNNLNTRVSVLVNKKGTSFRHLHARNNRKPPQNDIDQIRPQMLEVERRIEITCKLPGATSNIVENCRGVTCIPLKYK